LFIELREDSYLGKQGEEKPFMKLSLIEIKCFKNLIDQNLPVTTPCIGLVGLNESGKTNVLNAIRMLDWDYKPTHKDVSKLNDCVPCVIFHFVIPDDAQKKFSRKILEKMEEEPCTRFIGPDSVKVNSIRVTKTLSAENKRQSKITFDYDFDFKHAKNFSIISDDAAILQDLQIQVDNTTIVLKKGIVIETISIPEAYRKYFSELTKDSIYGIPEQYINKLVAESIPTVVYWEYDDKYLIPSEITYDELMEGEQPYEVSQPLFNMLMLPDELKIGGEDDLSERIEVWKTDASKRRKDSQIVNEEVNKYIKKIWKDYDQSFEIDLETEKITVHIKDPRSHRKNYYEMAERSQGFKTFVSFLLTNAAATHLDMLDNCVMVLDEPETHLHPSGVRFMRNELLNLAKDGNYVFYATHSIFMIDRENLRRHVIMEKIDERSVIKTVERDNITQESVIYEALGTRVDEFSISFRNVMFEGCLDRRMFQFFIDQCIKKKKNPFVDHDLLDGGGVKQIHKFFKDKIIPIGSKWQLILDNDKPAQQLVRLLKEIFPDGFGKTIEVTHYSDINGHELEDLLPHDIVQNAFNSALKRAIPDIEDTLNLRPRKVISEQINEFEGRFSIESSKKSDIEKNFKENLDQLIKEKLVEISKEKTIPNRADKFKETFTDYYAFVNGLVERQIELRLTEDLPCENQ
jgi:predicted ATP-dependent endonuclease of OLD family